MTKPNIHPRAGEPARPEDLVDLNQLSRDYHHLRPDPQNPDMAVSFGTSGHRGTPLKGTFTESHILAIAQAVCDHRKAAGITGPLFLGRDTHAISAEAEETALEVLAANGVEVRFQQGGGYTPTPAVSRAILRYNRGRTDGLADGIVITPSHNPPQDGGFKYNPPHGGPADGKITADIQKRANELLKAGNRDVRRELHEEALAEPTLQRCRCLLPYVEELGGVIDFEVIREAGIKIGVDPLGGASLPYWGPIRERYGIDLEVVNAAVDGQFSFMTLDHDGVIRMDCSSRYAMAGLVKLKDRYAIAFGNDPDADRHGIVAPSCGLLDPNAFLAVAIDYLLQHRRGWPGAARVGKTVVTSVMIDRVVAAAGRELYEAPVGFKWFAEGLHDGSLCFAGEESAGATFLQRDGGVWTTDKDGLILGLLAAEITARTKLDPGRYYQELEQKHGKTWYARVDRDVTPAGKRILGNLTPAAVPDKMLAGEPIVRKLAHAPGNGEAIGGLKIVTEAGWICFRPSGTEPKFKLYAESFRSAEHLAALTAGGETMLRNLGVEIPDANAA